MSRLVAIVPVKPLDEGKSRLSRLLSKRDRYTLNRTFLDKTLDLASRFPGSASTIVVSRSPEVLGLARQQGAVALRELRGADLNQALSQASELAREMGATATLIVPVDLPLATVQDVQYVVSTASPPAVVIVPDHVGRGTNLLFTSPVHTDEFHFGKDSLKKHLAAHLHARLLHNKNIGFDIDDASDYLRWRECLASKHVIASGS